MLFLSHSFSSIAHPAALCDTPKHHPGLYAVRSQLALEELSLPIQLRLLSGNNVDCMLGEKQDAHHEYSTQTILQSVSLGRPGRPVGCSQTSLE